MQARNDAVTSSITECLTPTKFGDDTEEQPMTVFLHCRMMALNTLQLCTKVVK